MKKHLLLLALPAIAVMLPSLVSADSRATEQNSPPAQLSCMAEYGFANPSGKTATPQTREQREKMKAAALACGLKKKDSSIDNVRPKTGSNAGLASAQISCMTKYGFVSQSGKTATPQTREQREKMKAAARACGLKKRNSR